MTRNTSSFFTIRQATIDISQPHGQTVKQFERNCQALRLSTVVKIRGHGTPRANRRHCQMLRLGTGAYVGVAVGGTLVERSIGRRRRRCKSETAH